MDGENESVKQCDEKFDQRSTVSEVSNPDNIQGNGRIESVTIADGSFSFNPITKSMYAMAKEKQFCDTEIISSDGVKFSAHSTVLATRSEMLKQSFLLSPTAKYKIQTEEISSSTWKILLEYMYLGSVSVRIKQLKDLKEAADEMEMEVLLGQCNTSIDEQWALGNMENENTVSEETSIEPELMKFAAGLSDNFEFVSTIDGEEENSGSMTQNSVIVSQENLLQGVECLQLDQTQGQEENNAVFYMVQDQGEGQNYILTTEQPGLEAIASTSDDQPNLQVIMPAESSSEPPLIISSVKKGDNVVPSTSSQGSEKTQTSVTKDLEQIKYPAGINPRGKGRPRTKTNLKTLFKCGICDRRYTTKQSLERHIKLHDDIHPYTCDICGKCFKTDRYLKCHILRHSEDRTYQCPICGKSFKTPRDANWHKKTVHTNTRPFQCQHCPYSSKTRALLNQHLLSHTSAKQWKCKTCGKTFLRKQHLEQHASRHEGKRQYMCSTCGSEFYTIYACKEHHMRVHQGIKRYECSVCHQQYNEKKSFMKHLQKHSVDLVLKYNGGDIVIEQTVEESTVATVV